jgi:hypothetical protein
MEPSTIVFIIVSLVIGCLIYALQFVYVGANNFKKNAQYWFDKHLKNGEIIDKLKKDKANLILETGRLKGIITTMEEENKTSDMTPNKRI